MTPGEQLDAILKDISSQTGQMTLGIVRKKITKRMILDYRSSLARIVSDLDLLIKRL